MPLSNFKRFLELSILILLPALIPLAYIFIYGALLEAVIIFLATVIIVFAVASALYQKEKISLDNLKNKIQLMAKGDFSQRISLDPTGLYAPLGDAINQLSQYAENVVKHLDSMAETRTEMIEQQSEKLENTREELQQTQNRLIVQEKFAALGSLTAGIAHEIKNPLNFINNFADLSLQIDKDMEERLEKIKSAIPPEDAEVLHDYLETLKLNISKIYEHGRRADSIIKNMLQHSRGTFGDIILTDVNLLLDEYVSLSFQGMRAQNPNFNVKIEKKYDPKIPKTYLVPQEISRVFLNILNNAFYSVNEKSSEAPSSYMPVVRVTTHYDQHYIVIKIWDNGEGIEQDVLSKLFTPFFTTKPVGEGTGLGLSLSYNIIVQGHQGMLTANSKEGEYAEFIISLPVVTRP